jgi:hypothetical protein
MMPHSNLKHTPITMQLGSGKKNTLHRAKGVIKRKQFKQTTYCSSFFLLHNSDTDEEQEQWRVAHPQHSKH